MTRCTPRRLGAFFVLAASACLVMLPAQAQTTEFTPHVRNFPAAALRGELVVLAPPNITMDDKTDQLSPGARIRDVNNMLVMSGTLINQTLTVNYLRENMGLVHQVWILNSEEIKQKRPNTQGSWWNWGSN